MGKNCQYFRFSMLGTTGVMASPTTPIIYLEDQNNLCKYQFYKKIKDFFLTFTFDFFNFPYILEYKPGKFIKIID